MIGLGLVVSYLWFDAWWGIIFAIPFCVYSFLQDCKKYHHLRNRKIRAEFKDFLVLLSGNLTAGYALENAFVQTVQDMKKQYGDALYIRQGIDWCVNGARVNRSIEVLFQEFATMTDVAEVADCASLLVLAKRYGGNMISMLKRVADHIAKTISVEQEIETSEAQKKLEGKIMLMAPFGVVAYMRMTNPGYMSVMYDTGFGIALMLIALIVIAVAGLWMNKILQM